MTNKTNFRTNPEQLKKAHASREIGRKPRPTYSSTPGEVMKRGQRLPQEVKDTFAKITNPSTRNDYIHGLAKAGWTATAIAEACGLTREAVRLILKNTKPTVSLAEELIPEAPKHPKREPIAYTEPNPEMLARLKELKPLAQLVRSSSPRYRAEAEEYSYLLNEATKQGVTVYRLGKLLGVTPSAIAFRLVRYGYRTTQYGQTKAYKAINSENRKAKKSETETM